VANIASQEESGYIFLVAASDTGAVLARRDLLAARTTPCPAEEPMSEQLLRQSVSLLSAEDMRLTLDTLARILIERHGNCAELALIGIQRRGVAIASDLRDRMSAQLGGPVLFGSLDITLYRDDWTGKNAKPAVGETRIPFDVQGKILILVDDVLFTGRTVRAALEALADFGRPGKVELLVLVDRGHRELPIHADYVGLVSATEKEDRVDVLVPAFDGEQGVRLVRAAG
jgi:pyrimidine operon attenuation protein/uracil phosphoribosyltransferase